MGHPQAQKDCYNLAHNGIMEESHPQAQKECYNLAHNGIMEEERALG